MAKDINIKGIEQINDSEVLKQLRNEINEAIDKGTLKKGNYIPVVQKWTN